MNTVLATESKDVANTSAINVPTSPDNAGPRASNLGHEIDSYSTQLFSHEEYRDDRYFATADSMNGGDYGFGYTIRMTHAGTYSVRPSRVFEFSNSEVFGRSAGKEVVVE